MCFYRRVGQASFCFPTDYANSAWANDKAVCPPYLTAVVVMNWIWNNQ